MIINVGITKALSDQFGVFAGIGYGAVVGVAEMYDPLEILADNGHYYVPDDELDSSGINFTAGGSAQLDRVTLEAGFNTFTSSVYIGVGTNF